MLLDSDPFRAFMPYPPVAVAHAGSGPLAGFTFGVKDLFDVAGYRTGCGNPVKLAQSPVASAHAPAVRMLLEAGARFVGKTHTEELAWSLYGTNVHFGTPVNPAAPARVPGGSSSGSASAVAGGLCDFALGSDTGGSVRAPASFCGIYGLRPTHGAIPLDGCMPLAGSFDTCGFFARDPALMLGVGRVLLPKSQVTLRQPMLAADLFARLTPAARDTLMPAVEKLEALLGKAKPVSVYDGPIDPIYTAFRQQQSAEVFAAHGAWLERTQAPLGPAIAGRFAYARTVTPADIAAAQAVRARFTSACLALLGEDGVLIAPVVPGAAPRLESSDTEFDTFRHEAMVFLQPAGLAGVPQLVIPAGMIDGAPIGLAITGPRGSDLDLLELAAG